MSPSPQIPRVLVVGAPQVGKSSLCQGITDAQELPREPCRPWAIRTKYYTANVEIFEAGANPRDACAQPEALVLVFSLAAPSTFGLARTYSEKFDLEAVEVKLLCGTYADALLASSRASGPDIETTSQPEWFQQAADWSIQNGFEFIICCPAVPSLDAALSLDGDQQGVARVVEALHAHTWPNLFMLPHGMDKAPNRATDVADARGAKEDADAPYTSGAEASAPREVLAPLPPREQERQQQQPSAQQDQQQEQHGSSHGEQRVAVKPSQFDADDTADNMLGGLERLMDDLRGHKARLATLSDEDRREQAAALALRMLELLGASDEDGDCGSVGD